MLAIRKARVALTVLVRLASKLRLERACNQTYPTIAHNLGRVNHYILSIHPRHLKVLFLIILCGQKIFLSYPAHRNEYTSPDDNCSTLPTHTAEGIAVAVTTSISPTIVLGRRPGRVDPCPRETWE